MLSFQQQAPSTNVGQPQAQQQQQHNDSPQQQQQPVQQQQQQQSPQQPQSQPAQLQQTMRLRDDPPPITPPARASRKRKTPPTTVAEQAQAQPLPPPPPSQPMQHALPPSQTLMHIQGPYAYAVPADYTPGGLPPGAIPGPHPTMVQQAQPQPLPQTNSTGRTLSNSKRAEQNRKAQRAFRERRDQHVKALETRSKMLDTALASADEANRRWEQCRMLVDQLRMENVALRAALSAQTPASLALPPVISVPSDTNGVAENPTAPVEEQKTGGIAEKDKEGDETGGSEQKE